MRYIYLVVLPIVVFVSCNQLEEKPIEVSEKEGIVVKITHSAGDRWEVEDDFLPLPFNIGAVGGHEFIVIADRIKKSDKLRVDPIGAIQLTKNDSTFNYVIAQPIETSIKSIRAEDFDEFSTVYSSAKWIIEQYLINRKGTGVYRLKGWEDRGFAVKHIIK